MSLPSSDGRQSASSMPSIKSSPTLNSRYSGAYADNGEGSSRQNSDARNHMHEEQHQSSESSLQEEAIEERDFMQRRRNRRSGGFLLDSAFSGGLRNRYSRSGGRAGGAKGKQSSHQGQAHDRNEYAERQHGGNGMAGGSPLSREVKMAGVSPVDADHSVGLVDMEERVADGIHVAKTRTDGPAVSFAASDAEGQPDAPIPRPVFDPNQLVNMALSLNESRRRNLSAGQLVAPQASGINRDGSFHSPGTGSGHLRQYLNEQRRVSRNISPFGEKSPGRHLSMSTQRKSSVMVHGQQTNPSDSTWRRVEKARAFIELRVEYLRLLEFLPPLKPDSTAPGNFVVMAHNDPGSPHAQLTRVPSYMGKQYDLGRPYNPMQLLRNRRSRARERRVFDHQPEEFGDPEKVRKWVDRVEEAARSPSYRQLDGVALPRFHEDHGSAVEPPKPSRPNKSWKFAAEELLADAHWLEHGDNKTIVEDRHGRRIFPPREPQKPDFLRVRSSTEYPEKQRRSWTDGLHGVGEHTTTGDESEGLSERGRKRRLLPTFNRAESPKHKKHNWMGAKQQTASDTDSSDSDSDLEKRRSKKTQRMMEGDNETGALKLRMKHLMEKEAQEKQMQKTPALFTPDTPNKWGQQSHVDVPDPSHPRNSLEVPGSSNGSAKAAIDLGLMLPPKQRTDPEMFREPSKEHRLSFEELDSTAPSTPLHPRHYPQIDGDFSPTPSRNGSERRKARKGKLDFLRSEESRNQKIDHLRPGSAGSDRKQSSRNPSEEPDESGGIGSAIWAAPGAVKNFLGHRKNDSMNSLTSPVKENRRDSREPSSAVTRFIKGVKNEGSKMGEFIFRKDRPAEDSDSDAASDRPTALGSETDEDVTSLRRKNRPTFARSNTAETAGSVSSKKNHSYHLELPSFRPSNQTTIDEDESDLSDHHITRQARATARNRSPRFDKLAPPGLDLSRISTASSRSPSQDRISQLLARPGGVGHAGLPVTSLAASKLPRTPPAENKSWKQSASPKRRPSRPTLEGKRHWSITDSTKDIPRHNIIVAPSDIARVRALFLCSGIKAREIARRAHDIRTPPPPFLLRAAKSADAELYNVPRMEEHVLAARILTTSLSTSLATLHSSTQSFKANTVPALTARITALTATLHATLSPAVRHASDAAVQLTSAVSSDAPLRVKHVTDDIEHMLRMRRRRTRWVRRLGWGVLEWVLLAFMWAIWGCVTVVGVGVRLARGVWGVGRWLLWL